jgi:DNA-binding transcriptional LysR family regulator
MVVQSLFDQHGLKPWIRMELSTSEAIKQAIVAGLGVSILSRYTLGLDVAQALLVTLDVTGFPLEHHWYFVYPAGKQLSLVARTFMDIVRVESKQLVYDHLAQNGS